MKKITIIIPAYNEEESLEKLYDRLSKVVNGITNYEFEMLFINDGSKDRTKEILKELREKAGLSQEALAGKLSLRGTDFSALMILRIEKGQRFVPDYELSVIADYFHVTSDYLLGRTNKE